MSADKGISIRQCKNAVVKTNKAIPMKVDGEPCLMAPCTIQIGIDTNIAGKAKMLKNSLKTKDKVRISKKLIMNNAVGSSYMQG